MITKQRAHIWQNDIVRATRDGAAAAAATDKQVVHSSKPMNSKDMSMAGISPEVSRCHVCFCSCVLGGVGRWGSWHRWLPRWPGWSTVAAWFPGRRHLDSFRSANGPAYHLFLWLAESIKAAQQIYTLNTPAVYWTGSYHEAFGMKSMNDNAWIPTWPMEGGDHSQYLIMRLCPSCDSMTDVITWWIPRHWI